MPSRNIMKSFVPNSMYHVYNRGVDKRIIFVDERDYAVFLSFLKYALLSDEDVQKHQVIDAGLLSSATRFNLRREGLHGVVELVSYCLMPNHFHLQLFQYEANGVTRLMQSIATGYVMYFNKRHGRTGALFQSRYKASKIDSQAYWDHISRYIHLNPLDLGSDYKNYQYSSFKQYEGKVEAEWVRPGLVIDSYRTPKDYVRFVDEYIPHRAGLKDVKDILANSREL
jgi:putative transposase